MKERTVNLRSRSKQVDTRRAHVRLSMPMKEIYVLNQGHITVRAFRKPHAPPTHTRTSTYNVHYKGAPTIWCLLIIIDSKENDYVITKVINFVVDSPARQMKAKNKIMHYLYLKK
jgi:hypothetical protein